MPSEQRLHPISILFAFGGSLKAFALPGLLVLIAGYVGTGLALGVTHVMPRSVGDFSQSLLLQLSLVLGAGLVAVSLLRAPGCAERRAGVGVE